MPKFSIIIPVYNVEKYLEESVNSILNQSYKDFELILVDDGSKDNSKRICENYASIDERVRVINCENSGSGIARNKGIDIAIGEYCYFADADDTLLPDALYIMNQEINNSHADLYVFGYILKRRDMQKEIKKNRINLYIEGKTIRENYQFYMEDGETYIQGAPWNKLFKTKNIKENNVFYPDLRRNQDEVFIVRYMNTVNSVKFSDKLIYKYYVNNLQDEWNKFPKDYFEIRTKVYREFKENIIKWNPENVKVKILINFMYIRSMVMCFEYMFNPKWEMDKEARKDYIKSITNNNEVKTCINFLLENKKEVKRCMKESNEKVSKIKLLFLQMKLIKKQRIKFIYIMSKFMINIRELYRKTQYR